MSEIPAATPAETIAPAAMVEPIPAEVAPPELDVAAEAAKWKALARKHEDQAKANADKARKFDEAQAASLSEIEKAQKAAAEADSKAAALEARLAIAQAAITHKLDEEDLAALEGIPADKVDAVAARLGAKKAAAPSAAPTAKQGIGSAATAPSQLTEADLNSMTPMEVNKARREGRLKSILSQS